MKEFIPYLKQVGFTGGEPFLIPIYYKIWDVVINLNPDLPIYVSSNGSVLNEKIKYYLEKLNFNFTISIDSLDAQTYQNIRKTQSLTM